MYLIHTIKICISKCLQLHNCAWKLAFLDYGYILQFGFYIHFLCICINNSTLIVPDNTSTSEYHSASQDVVPRLDHVTVHSTPAGKHSLVN